jgi:hypothetical protein
MVTVEIADVCGLVVLMFDDGGDHVEIVMSPDECREFCNHLGAAILGASRAKVMMT